MSAFSIEEHIPSPVSVIKEKSFTIERVATEFENPPVGLFYCLFFALAFNELRAKRAMEPS
jgi:hypothetical protein